MDDPENSSHQAKKFDPVNRLAARIHKLSLKNQLKLIQSVMQRQEDNKTFLQDAFFIVTTIKNRPKCGSDRKRLFTEKVEHWMEKRLVNAPPSVRLTPKRLAYEYRYYHRLSYKMEPFLMVTAKRVKARLYWRAKNRKEDECTDSVTRKIG